jgi:hypothetical protein
LLSRVEPPEPNASPHAPRARDPLVEGWPPDDDWPSARRSPPRAWIRAGLWTGAVAGAATAGVLVRYGHAAGIGYLGAFAHVGRLATGVTLADGRPAQAMATITGLLLHLLVVSAWSLLFAAVAAGWGEARRWLAAFVIALLAWGAGHAILPGMLRLGHGARAFPIQEIALHLVLAVALALGMRLALPEAAEQ